MVDKSLDKVLDVKADKSPDTTEITQEMKDRIRMAVESTGPLSIPKDLLDSNYNYIQPLHDTEHPSGSYSRARRLGYEHVTAEMMPDLFDMKNAMSGGYGLTKEGDRVCVKVTDKQTHYLMRIHLSVYNEIAKIQSEINHAPMKAVQRQTGIPGFEGRIEKDTI